MSIQFPDYQNNIIKFGLAAVAVVALGACLFKDKITSIAKIIWTTAPHAKSKQLAGRIGIPKKNSHLDKLILYFDINKTLILDDSAKKGRTPEQTVIIALAQSIVDIWDQKYGAMSFEQYASILIPNSQFSDPVQLKEARQKVIYGFLDWLREKNHPAKKLVLEKYSLMMRKIIDPNTQQVRYNVFDSFYLLLDKLRKCQLDFVVILMTFGDDLDRVAKEIGKHPSGIKFTRYGEFHAQQLHLKDGITLVKADEIFQAFLKSGHHYALKASYKEWHADGERGRSGKPFIFDSTGKMHGVRNLSLISDDNITLEDDKDIVAPIDIAGGDVQKKKLNKPARQSRSRRSAPRSYVLHKSNGQKSSRTWLQGTCRGIVACLRYKKMSLPPRETVA